MLYILNKTLITIHIGFNVHDGSGGIIPGPLRGAMYQERGTSKCL